MAPTLDSNSRVLDYGCADGQLFHHLSDCKPENMFGYDPSQQFLDECTFEGSTLSTDIASIVSEHPQSFDTIFCMEVCEHLTTEELHKLGANIRSLAKPGATIVIGVPIESGLGSLAKNIFRILRSQRGVTFNKAFRSLFGLPIVRAYSPRGWIGTHVGFDYQYLADLLPYVGLVEQRRLCLPLPILGAWLNNEIYFICKVGPIS